MPQRSDFGNLPQPDRGEGGPTVVGRHRSDQSHGRREHQGQSQGNRGGRGHQRLCPLRPQQPHQIMQDF